MITSRNYIKLDEKVNSITSIPPRAKILHGEICALSQTDGFCFASNKYFARRLNLSIQSVSRLIGVLKRYKLITVSRITDDNGYRKRIIKPNSSITLSKISVGNAQKREKHTLKNANYKTGLILTVIKRLQSALPTKICKNLQVRLLTPPPIRRFTLVTTYSSPLK